MKPFWIAPAIVVALVGCNTANLETTAQPPPTTNKVLGLLEVTLDMSDERQPTGTANFRPLNSSQKGVPSRAVTANNNETSQLAFRRRSVGFIDDNESGVFGTQTRYVRGTFDVANFGPRAFNNLNFMATSLNTQLGTMFSSLKNAAEVVIPSTDTLPTGELTYRAMKPAHGMRPNAEGGLEVDPNLADMQVFAPTEASTVKSTLYATYPGLQVLEYGYTARSLPTSRVSRNIAITPTSADCSSTLSVPPNGYTLITNNTFCFTGRVTFAFKFPRKPVRSQNPFVFSFVFVVSDETTPSTTQSLDEQGSGLQPSLEQVLGLNTPVGESRRIRTLAGSGIFGYPNPTASGVQRDLLCNVKTAMATTSPVLPADYLSAKPGLTNFIPSPNTMFASTSSSVLTSFCEVMNAPLSSSFVVNGSQTGRHSSDNGVYSGAGSSLFYAPSTAFKPGEEVQVSLSAGLTRLGDSAVLNPLVYRFRMATAAQGSSGFAPKVDYSTGAYPFNVVTGDFNGDGKLDLATANYSASTLSVLLGSGGGTFGIKTDYPTGLFPWDIVTGDFNGDGNLDLATANASSSTMSVLLGSGGGTFGTKTDYPTGVTPVSIVTGDFNGDGILDLVTGNGDSKSLSVMLGTGVGIFNARTDYRVGSYPYGLVVGDFNGDGKLDLAAANTFSSSLSVLLGSGVGTFDSKTDYPTGINPFSLVTGDFNGDGKLDLAAANYGINFSVNLSTLSVWLGTGSGIFGVRTDYQAGVNPNSVVTGDFNGDGKLDLASVNYTSSDLSVLLGSGDGSFGAATVYATGSSPVGLDIGDFNGDGRLDLVTTSTTASTVNVLLKN